jgi:hypothetical protein
MVKNLLLVVAVVIAAGVLASAAGPPAEAPVNTPGLHTAKATPASAPALYREGTAQATTPAPPSVGPAALPAKQRSVKPVGQKKKEPASATPSRPPAAVAKRETKPPEAEKEKVGFPLPPISARRDPFRNPMLVETSPVSLPPGKAGLIISQLRVDGLVRAPSGMLAVVTNTSRRTYFLREGDQLYDGSVQRITSESVVFQENTKDMFGRAITREVVKRLYPTAGEGK